MGHVPILDPHQRLKSESLLAPGTPARESSWAQKERYQERTMIERVNARIKNEFGGSAHSLASLSTPEAWEWVYLQIDPLPHSESSA